MPRCKKNQKPTSKNAETNKKNTETNKHNQTQAHTLVQQVRVTDANRALLSNEDGTAARIHLLSVLSDSEL
jgi:hypothetical protein